jgi:DNA-binding TFAR19-related protein (PDSD5 family)
MVRQMAEQNSEMDDTATRKAVSRMYKQMQQDQQVKSMLRQLLDSNAYERMMNIRASNRELYDQLARLIVSLAQSNQVAHITEKQLVDLIDRLTRRPEPKIEFKHK